MFKNNDMQDGKSKKIVFLENILRRAAVLILKKYEPRIIGITGSVGKTSAKEAVYAVLASRFRVRKNEKNYNNEIGLPLTIIGAGSGGSSVFRWLGVFGKALAVLVFPVEYPEILVLEMGADRPGDIEYLTGFIKCELAVITDISGSHLEYFKTIDKVAEEKWRLVSGLSEKGTAIVNIDNPKIAKLRNQKKYEKINFLTFGFSESADLKAADVFYNYEDEEKGVGAIKGIGFKLSYKGTTLPVRFTHILAEHNIYAALAGISAGITFGLNLVDISAAIENFSMPQGRMNLIAGIKDSVIIDDTYNASPVSTVSALKVLGNIRAQRKIAVLGDMLELGTDTESGHKDVAKKFLEIGGDIFLAVGKRMKFAVEELQKHNIGKDRLFVFENPMEAGRRLKKIVREGDLVLVKGSQGMRMEKVVEEIMAEPQKAGDYLCRQDKAWKEKPWRPV